ncbi:MAG: phosphoenolpyruvate synthase [Dehalococcoidia bacterium]|nr:phosphoenolpyruvate synthase [Dehalococcoidia bacterium]MDD5495371.1 phosphoenolpyruvate synthase [Dehalococcoidia bacterium]
MEIVKWFEELGKGDVVKAGGKGANLGELVKAGLPVPPGFVITAQAYQLFTTVSGLSQKISHAVEELNVDDTAQLQAKAKEIQELIINTDMPLNIRSEIIKSYEELSKRDAIKAQFVAVRSSATMEDSEQASFAGMNATILNVHGKENLIKAVKECWASLYGARVIFYRAKKDFLEEPVIAVVVQKMVNSEKAGVMFTANPSNNNLASLVIEGAFGLGEVVVGGLVSPDYYEIDKASMKVKDTRIAHKNFKIIRDEKGQNKQVNLTPREAELQVLTDAEVQALTSLGLRIEEHYNSPQDTEWAIEGDKIYMVQSRPITTLIKPTEEAEKAEEEGKELIRGLGASPGRGSGEVRVLASPTQDNGFESGDILVAEMTTPDWVPLMKKASAIVTDGGGMTCHAAIVSREMGLPCVVGTRNATKVLVDKMLVTVDGTHGIVYEGKLKEKNKSAEEMAGAVMPRPAPLVTATKLYVNLAMPYEAERIAKEDVDGVGLLRAEFMVIDACDGVHPRQLMEEGKSHQFIDAMVRNLRIFTRAFYPRPVIYRAIDFRTNEFRNLRGGDKYEPVEQNPMIGFRGCYRYVLNPDLFELELKVLLKVREQDKNLHLMIPFVRTLWEFKRCKQLIDNSGLSDDRELELWVMAEVPSVVYWLEDYVKAGITGVSIGSNDLTQLVLGVDRDSEVCAPLYDERDKAVLDAIRQIIQTSRRMGITCSICGQAPSNYTDFAEKLVDWGITSVSVNPDVIGVTRRNIASAEQRMLLKMARKLSGSQE